MKLDHKSEKSLDFQIFAGLFVLCCFFFAGCDAQQALTQKRIKTAEKGLMRAVFLKGLKPGKVTLAERMQFYQVPGVSIAVLDKNRLEWARAYGEKDNQTHQPLTVDTLFQGGAFSQMMTAAAAIRLAEKGKLDLDADIGGLLRTWKLPPAADTEARRKITARSLLTHSSGLSDQVFEGYAQGESLPALKQILDGEKPANNGPVWIHGRRSSVSMTRYSEPGYVVIEELLLDRTGMPFPSLMKESLFDPLGLKNSAFEVPLSDGLRLRAAAGSGKILSPDAASTKSTRITPLTSQWKIITW